MHIAKFSTGDPEEFTHHIRGATLDHSRLTPLRAPSSYARLILPQSALDLMSLGSATSYAGESSKDHFTLVFATSCPQPGLSFSFGALEHRDEILCLFPPGSTVAGWKPAGFSHASLTIPTEDFHSAISRYYPEFPDEALARGGAFCMAPTAKNALQSLVSDLEASVWDPADPLAGDTVRRCAETDLVPTFLSALCSQDSELTPSDTRLMKRYARLQQAQDFIAAHDGAPVHLEDLCAALSLGRRSVENLFKNLLGVCPTAYLRNRRLHAVRRALLAADPSWGGVKQVALNFGFWHMGRFATEYKKLFGESPGETLAKSDRSRPGPMPSAS